MQHLRRAAHECKLAGMRIGSGTDTPPSALPADVPPVAPAGGAAHGDPLDDLVGAFLTASRVLVAVTAQSIVGLEDTVTLPQFRTLVILESHGEINLNRLAQLLDVNSSSAVRMIDRLVAAGFVDRRENPDNRRQVILTLTREGARIVRRVTESRRRALGRIVARMKPDPRAHLIAALRAFSDAAGEPGAGDGEVGNALGW